MRGKAVFYPVGWDDNGLPTERRVQNHYRVRCDPSLPYDPELIPARPGNGPGTPAPVAISRRNFIELCQELTARDERGYAAAFRRAGLSVDWASCYRTIGDGPRAASQRAFLRALGRGDAYQAEAPVLWDVSFQTAVAQAEIEDRETGGLECRIGFAVEGGGELVVATTRPELLPACVALVAHPSDERYAPLIGSAVRTPLFGVSVPVLGHRLADPAKGTGIAMICTFGDMTDVTWWRELRLPAHPVIGADGRLAAGPPAAITSRPGRAAYARLAGLTAAQARRTVTGLLREAGGLRGEPTSIRHPVKFYEKGEQPLEIITARQWYIRNGANDPVLREALLARGAELRWHPEHMRSRYENWVNGLTGDWLISRQRFFGVPIPLWYPLGEDGQAGYSRPITPGGAELPVDPASDTPPGYRTEQRGQPGGFAADPDVMDTWATSSLTPEIAAGCGADPDLWRRVFPMDLRPQAHEIIRTWLFYTVLRSHTCHGVLPWRHAAISGWIMDPDRKKMSKSAGNVVTPEEVLREFGSDAARYWAASARLGTDAVFDRSQLKIGRRLCVKILNASSFVLSLPAAPAAEPAPPRDPLDRALAAKLAGLVPACTEAFEGYDHATALELTERFFWFFCDDYLELVKARGYGERGASGQASAQAALRLTLSVLLRLFAPFLPFTTEEVWSWWQDGSVHRAAWPDGGEAAGAAAGADPAVLDAAAAAIAAVRKAKSEARLPLRAGVRQLTVTAGQPFLDLLAAGLDDVRAAGHIAAVELRPAAAAEPAYRVTL
jgi:valyl-tRNA synthetase